MARNKEKRGPERGGARASRLPLEGRREQLQHCRLLGRERLADLGVHLVPERIQVSGPCGRRGCVGGIRQLGAERVGDARVRRVGADERAEAVERNDYPHRRAVLADAAVLVLDLRGHRASRRGAGCARGRRSTAERAVAAAVTAVERIREPCGGVGRGWVGCAGQRDREREARKRRRRCGQRGRRRDVHDGNGGRVGVRQAAAVSCFHIDRSRSGPVQTPRRKRRGLARSLERPVIVEIPRVRDGIAVGIGGGCRHQDLTALLDAVGSAGGSVSIMSLSTPPARSVCSAVENSKSLKSPRVTMFALGSTARIWSTKSFSTWACWFRCVSEARCGGWKRPNSGWSPPFELKWLAIMKKLRFRILNSAASGFRLELHAALVGSLRQSSELSGPRRDGR